MSDMIKAKLTGMLPLLMHNERLANPLDDAARKMRGLTAKRKKTEDDMIAISYAEFEGGLYLDEKGPYIPAHWILAMIRDGAKLTKQGKDAVRAILLNDPKFPLEYSGPKDVQGLWKKGFFDRRMVGNQKNRVLRTRPRFNEWGVTFTLQFDESVFDRAQIESILKTAGNMVGLGDYRPLFGRFEVEIA